jgi:hypothetical protein
MKGPGPLVQLNVEAPSWCSKPEGETSQEERRSNGPEQGSRRPRAC